MSTTFFIAPYTKKDWIDTYSVGEGNNEEKKLNPNFRIDPKDYQEALSKRWPSTQFKKLDGVLLSWILPADRAFFSGMRGHLHKNLQVVSFNAAYKEIFVDFIVWHRAYISAAQRLYIFNSSEEQSVEIKADITENEVIKITGIID